MALVWMHAMHSHNIKDFLFPSSGVLKSTIPLVVFEDIGPNSSLHFLCHDGDPAKPRSVKLPLCTEARNLNGT